MPVKAPLTWFGGKGLMLDELLPRVPSHMTYVEVFGGGGQLLFGKSPDVSKLEVYNDIDSSLVEFFAAIQHDEESEILIDRWTETPYSREKYMEYLKSWRYQEDRLERIYQWFIVARQSFSGRFGAGWMFAVKERSPAKVYRNIVDGLIDVKQRIRDVQLENKDWSDMLDTYDHKDCFFYLDPPYVHSTRRAGGYVHEMSDDDHIRLIERVQTLEGKVMLSGYDSDIYKVLQWKREDIDVIAPSAGKTRNSKLQGEGMGKKYQSRVESIWTNYETDSQISLF